MPEKPPKPPSELSPEKLTEPVFKEEHEKLPTFFLVYRDNPLYKEFGPKIADVVTGLGYRVTTQVFPEGTPEDVIKKWHEEHKTELEGNGISDDTFARSTGKRVKYSLDEIVESATIEVVLGLKVVFGMPEKMKEFETEDIEKTKEVFVGLLKRVFEVKENIPSKVFILAERITDHVPFSFKRTSKGELVLTPDGKPERIWKYDKADPDDIRYAISQLTEWLGEAGIPKENIFVEREINDDNEEDIINQKGAWIISDRHYSHSAEFPERKRITGKVLRLPLFDFFDSLMSEELLDLGKTRETNKEEVIHAIERRLVKYFGKKSKEE